MFPFASFPSSLSLSFERTFRTIPILFFLTYPFVALQERLTEFVNAQSPQLTGTDTFGPHDRPHGDPHCCGGDGHFQHSSARCCEPVAEHRRAPSLKRNDPSSASKGSWIIIKGGSCTAVSRTDRRFNVKGWWLESVRYGTGVRTKYTPGEKKKDVTTERVLQEEEAIKHGPVSRYKQWSSKIFPP